MVAEPGSTPHTMAVEGSPYTNALDDYDLNIRNMNSTGHPGVDAELNHMIAQTHRVKESCSYAFLQLDKTTKDLYEYANRTDMHLINMKVS